MRALAAVRSLLLGPLWTLQLLTGAKSFMDNPIIGSRWLNARGLHTWRMRNADRLATSRRQRLAALISDEDRAAFDRDGYVLRRNFLPPAQFAALLQQVKAYRGMAREELQGDAVTRRIACDRATREAMPALSALQAQPAWRGLIRYAGSFDAEPLVYVQTILSHARPGDRDPQEVLHSDTFHATVKAWLFLSDVPADCMSFTYVPGSHQVTPQRLAWEKAQSLELSVRGDYRSRRGSLRILPEALPAIGLPPPKQLAVSANTLVVADTHGFHARGPSATPTQRVEIWAYGRRNPFLPLTGLDPWRLRALCDRRIGWFWRAGDLLDRLGIKRQVWKRAPDTAAFDGLR
jgi:hypothetical protein